MVGGVVAGTGVVGGAVVAGVVVGGAVWGGEVVTGRCAEAPDASWPELAHEASSADVLTTRAPRSAAFQHLDGCHPARALPPMLDTIDTSPEGTKAPAALSDGPRPARTAPAETISWSPGRASPIRSAIEYRDKMGGRTPSRGGHHEEQTPERDKAP